MEFVDEPVTGFYEGLVVVVLDEADNIATFAADKTLKDVLFLVDVHRGMFVVVVPACGAFSEFAHAIEGDAEFGADIEDGYLADFLKIQFVVFHLKLFAPYRGVVVVYPLFVGLIPYANLCCPYRACIDPDGVE